MIPIEFITSDFVLSVLVILMVVNAIASLYRGVKNVNIDLLISALGFSLAASLIAMRYYIIPIWLEALFTLIIAVLLLVITGRNIKQLWTSDK